MAALFKDMARMTIAMNQEFLSETEIIRITNEEFVEIRRDDLGGEFDLRIDISTPEKDEETAEKIYKLMQTNAATMDPEIVKMHYVKIAELWKQPDLARKIEEFKPEPDPVQQQIQQIQLENAMLANAKLRKDIDEADSRIHERISRALENETDIENKKSQLLLREAQTRKLNAEADLNDQKFLRTEDGVDRKEKIQDETLRHASKMDEYDKKKGHIEINRPGSSQLATAQGGSNEIEDLKQQIATMQQQMQQMLINLGQKENYGRK
jgi:hypothetical protein